MYWQRAQAQCHDIQYKELTASKGEKGEKEKKKRERERERERDREKKKGGKFPETVNVIAKLRLPTPPPDVFC